MPWAQPATGFSGQLMTNEVAGSWCPQSRASACLLVQHVGGGHRLVWWASPERRGDGVIPAPGREEGRAHHASGVVWGGHC